jgi:plastocyanin
MRPKAENMSRTIRRLMLGARTPLASILLLGAAVLIAAASAAAAQDVIRVGTLPGLRYDISEFSVRPGTNVELIFTNSDEMLHNLAITRPGARERVVQAALALGPGAAERDFVPDTPDVLWATTVVPTNESASVRFTAPSAPGDYPFVCTMPAHGLIMFGTMKVTNTPGPPVKTPVDEPVAANHDAHGAAAAVRGIVVRGFMPDAGPASISVQLPGGVSYVWDAGAGRFRYAWSGGIPALPSSPERGLARIPGEVFYREPAFPLRVGAAPAAAPKLVQFKGYSLDAAGIPEFETVVDGVTVRERADVRDGRLVRRFRTTGATTVWFAVPNGAADLQVTGGVREGAYVRLSGAAAREFTVTYPMPASPGAPAPGP